MIIGKATLIGKATKRGSSHYLPTEAQWEFAARGGNLSKGYFYSGSDNWSEIGSDDNNSEVKCKLPNELGFYDMSGCAMEVTADKYSYYSTFAQIDPENTPTNGFCVLRLGSGAFGVASRVIPSYDLWASVRPALRWND